jgi:hypothetical protein
MRFSDILKGTRARKTIEVDFGHPDGPVPVDIRKLTPPESVHVLEASRAFAKSKGVEDPSDGDALYDFAFRVHTIALACVETGSPENEPKPFFESAKQILESRLISDDVVEYIFAHWELHVDETSLQRRQLTTPEILRLVASLGGGDIVPFIKLSPGQQVALASFMAGRLLSSSPSSSPSTSPSSTEPNDDVLGPGIVGDAPASGSDRDPG